MQTQMCASTGGPGSARPSLLDVLRNVARDGLASLCGSAFDSPTLTSLAVQAARSEKLLMTGCFLLQAVAIVHHWQLTFGPATMTAPL